LIGARGNVIQHSKSLIMNSGTIRLGKRLLATLALFLLGAASGWAQGQAQGGRGGAVGGGGGGGGGFGGGGGTSGATRTYQNTTLVGDATISSDVDTRKLVVVTDATTYESIKAVLAELDKPKPQVLINVVFLQVTHDKDLDFGAEASLAGSLQINREPNGRAPDSTSTRFGVGSQYNDPAAYGAYYRILGQDVTATIHALSQNTKTEVLSRPSILTRSNQQATILVGQSIPLLTGSTQNTNSNSITSTVTYQDVGIILRVTPFITNDGLVEMIVSPEISSLSATTVVLPGGGSSPVIDRRSADTVVVTPSDRTIVIGGLISNQKNDTKSKVPILGDIPLLGAAFSRTTKRNVKTELLIFLTPHVVAKPEDLAALTDTERANLNLAPTTFDQGDLSKFLPNAKN
jgi:general secretion pathway protein D